MTTPPPPPPTPSRSLRREQAAAKRRDRWLGLWWPIVAAATSATAIFLQIRPAGIWNDDIFNLQQHRVGGTLGELLLEPVFATQIAPGHRLLTELQLQIGPTDRVLLHVLLAALIGVCVLLGARITLRLSGPSFWAPFLLSVVLAGPAGVTTTLWYAAAFHLVPALAAGLAAVLLYLRWRGDPSGESLPPGWPRASVAVLLLGLLFSLKALIAVLFLVLLEYVLLRRGDLETVLVGVWRDRRVWGSYGLLAGVYWFLTQRAGLDPPIGDSAVLIEAVARGIATMSIPMLLGLASAQAQYLQDPLPTGVLFGSWAVVGGLAIVWARRSKLAARGLVVSVVILVVGLGVSAASRTPGFGVEAALTPRYHFEGLVFVILAMAAGLRDTNVRPVTAGLVGRPWVSRAAQVLAVAGMLAGLAWSNANRLEASLIVDSGEWIALVEENLAGSGRAPQVLDTPLPDFVIPLFPGRRLTDLEGLVPRLDVDPLGADSVVTDEGTVEPLDATMLFEQTGREFSTNGLVGLNGEYEASRAGLCSPTSMTIDIVLGPHPAPRIMALTVSGDASIRTDYTPRLGLPGEPPAEVDVTGGAERLTLPMDLLGWVDRIGLTMTATGDEPVCLDVVRFFEVHNDLPGRDEIPG